MRAAESTDDELIDSSRAGSLRAWFQQAADRLAGADPGLTQLRTATQAVLGVLVTIVLIYVFVQATGALQLPADAAPAPVITATNHALLIVSMLVGGILAMMAGFTVNDPSRAQQLLSTLMLPIPMLASITIGLAVGPYRLASLVYLVVVMTVSVYVRRFGPRGFAAGLVAFQGGFLGFFLHKELHFRDLGWLAADLGIAIVASLIVRFGLLRTDREQTLDRMRRSWQARAYRLLDFTADAVCAPDPRHRTQRGVDPLRRDTRDERIRQQVVRLNESTLIVEAQLVLTSPTSARVEAQQLFDAELSLTNCARFGAALAHVLVASDEPARADVVAALHAARDEDWPLCRDAAARLRAHRGSIPRVRTLLRRLALSVEQYASADGAACGHRRAASRQHDRDVRAGNRAEQRVPARFGAGQRAGLDHAGPRPFRAHDAAALPARDYPDRHRLDARGDARQSRGRGTVVLGGARHLPCLHGDDQHR